MSEEKPSTVTRRDIAVAGVSFMVSGVGGALFQRWISRAEPSIAIVSLGFAGGSVPIVVPPDLAQMSRADSWGANLNDTVMFDELRKRYRANEDLIARHEKAIPIVESWIAIARSRLVAAQYGATKQLTSVELADHPYMADNLIGSSLHGMIRRLQVGMPPIVDMGGLLERMPMHTNSDYHVIQNQRTNILFPLDNLNTNEKRRVMKAMAESFAKGCVENLLFYSEAFLVGAKDDLLKLKALEKPLRELLVTSARLSAMVSVRNTGGTSTIFRPYYAISLVARQYKKTFVMEPLHTKERELQDERPDRREREPRSQASEQLKILPEAFGTEFIQIPAGAVRQITLQSTTPLGKDGEAIVGHFQNDIIECTLHGFTLDGKSLVSERIPFGKSTVEREQDKVVKQVAP